MKLNRFYFPEQYQVSKKYTLPIDICHKIINVLRHKIGDTIIIFNGKNIEATCKIISKHSKNVTVQIESINEKNIESPINIHLGQAITKINKMELIIQKACELGIYSITPIITERTIVKIKNDKAISKISHWQKIAIAACEQSGRNFVPTINQPVKLEDWINNSKNNFHTNFIMHPDETNNAHNSLNDTNDINDINDINDTNDINDIKNNNLNTLKQKEKNNNYEISLLVGPEGGFTTHEIEFASKNKFIPISLGPRILRAETAAIAGICALQIRYGDF